MKILSIILAVICILIIISFIISYFEFRTFKITRYNISDENLPDSFNEFKIAVISDLHNYNFDEDNKKILECLEKEEFDYLLLPGDMVLCKKNAALDNLKTAKFISTLCEKYNVIYSIGNHEKGLIDRKDNVGDIWLQYKALLPDDIKILSNESIEIKRNDDSIIINGLDIERRYYRRLCNMKMDKEYISERLGEKKDCYTIMLAHNPDYFDAYESWGANLIISGHIHGGIVRIPGLGGVISPRLRLFPKYDYGLFEKNETKMIVSSGLGAHFPKIRIFNKPEVVFIKLKRK